MRCAALPLLLLVTFGCAEQRTTVRAVTSLTPPIDLTMLTVWFRAGGRAWQAHASDFTADASLALPHTIEWNAGTPGPIDVAFELRDSTGAVVAGGQVPLPPRTDWRWDVYFFNVTQDPRSTCLGCSGAFSFSLAAGYQAPGRDSLWVVWGGNSISNPVIY